jgi:hypothetical protein
LRRFPTIDFAGRLNYLGDGLVRFFRGFWPKRAPKRGFLMVNSWWMAGESWFRDGYFSGLEICRGFRVYFCDSHGGRDQDSTYPPTGKAFRRHARISAGVPGWLAFPDVRVMFGLVVGQTGCLFVNCLNHIVVG